MLFLLNKVRWHFIRTKFVICMCNWTTLIVMTSRNRESTWVPCLSLSLRIKVSITISSLLTLSWNSILTFLVKSIYLLLQLRLRLRLLIENLLFIAATRVIWISKLSTSCLDSMMIIVCIWLYNFISSFKSSSLLRIPIDTRWYSLTTSTSHIITITLLLINIWWFINQ